MNISALVFRSVNQALVNMAAFLFHLALTLEPEEGENEDEFQNLLNSWTVAAIKGLAVGSDSGKKNDLSRALHLTVYSGLVFPTPDTVLAVRVAVEWNMPGFDKPTWIRYESLCDENLEHYQELMFSLQVP